MTSAYPIIICLIRLNNAFDRLRDICPHMHVNVILSVKNNITHGYDTNLLNLCLGLHIRILNQRLQ